MSIKIFKSSHICSIILFLTIFIFFSFKGCTKDSKNPIIDDDQNSVFTKAPDSTKVITIETSSGGKLRVMGNNVLIKVDSENVDNEIVKSIIEETEGELVGQIPMLGIYQAEYRFSTSSELEAMIGTLNAYSEVEFATYNALAKNRNILHDKEYCNKDYDNHNINNDLQHNFEDMEYYLAIPLMGLVREHMTLNKVTVAIFDSRIEVDRTKEFNDVTIIDYMHLNNTAPPPPQPYTHGTQVAGVIAADNKDGGINGIASSLIGNKLELLSSAIDTPCTVIQDLERIMDVGLDDNVQICNISSGYGGLDKHGNAIDVHDIRFLYEVAFYLTDNTLFVVAAGNEYFKITEDNDCPAGIQLPNVITVAGTKYNNPQQACSWSSYGPLMDIAAPCENWPLVNPDQANTLMTEDGNSYGTPSVTALAAVLKSIKPSLSPGDIKSYILDNSSSTAASISGRRLVIPQPIEQLLIDMQAPDEILRKIDWPPDGEWDLPGVVAARICNISKIEIAGEPIMECETSDTSNTGSVIENTGGMIVFSTGSQLAMVRFHNTHEILNSVLEIVKYEGEGLTDGVTVSYLNSNTLACGNSISGSITIENGLITERYPGTNYPMVIEAEGTMSGVMEMVLSPGIDITYSNFSGSMLITLLIPFIGSEEFYEYFENNCY